jgi:hypothetical protein
MLSHPDSRIRDEHTQTRRAIEMPTTDNQRE